MAKFPTLEWVQMLSDKLNTDEKYAQIAHKWEGDLSYKIDAGGSLTESVTCYFDLWHGKCRAARILEPGEQVDVALKIVGTYENSKRIVTGEMDVLQAMVTRKLSVHGNMALIMRNVPTVLDFVRCCREVTDSFV
jgi:putative sterol carrier protein